jgi:hypothetical protein
MLTIRRQGMLRKLLTGMFFLLFVCGCFYPESFAQSEKKQIKIVGQVTAIDDSVSVSSMPVSHDLVIKVVMQIEGDEQATYLKVVYQPLHGQKGLPKEMWSSQSRWVFTLQKATDEDESCKEPVRGWIRTKPETGQDVPDVEKLPCYLLGADGFQPYKNRR